MPLRSPACLTACPPGQHNRHPFVTRDQSAEASRELEWGDDTTLWYQPASVVDTISWTKSLYDWWPTESPLSSSSSTNTTTTISTPPDSLSGAVSDRVSDEHDCGWRGSRSYVFAVLFTGNLRAFPGPINSVSHLIHAQVATHPLHRKWISRYDRWTTTTHSIGSSSANHKQKSQRPTTTYCHRCR